MFLHTHHQKSRRHHGMFPALLVLLLGSTVCAQSPTPRKSRPKQLEVATFAGGCFWCMEAAFDKVPGVWEAASGYTGGKAPNPTYDEVSSGSTGHLETVRVEFDPTRVSYQQLLDVFWHQIDPTDAGGQFADRGPQYRTAIFVHNAQQRKLAEASLRALEHSGVFAKPIKTRILSAGPFYRAEEYHQDYHLKHPFRYHQYRVGSGREGFLQRVWGNRPNKHVQAGKKPSAAELRKRLTPLQYHVTQENGTERPFDNRYWHNKADGIYVDIVSGEALFSSKDKFASGTGWPSFTRPLEPNNVVRRTDRSAFMTRVEVRSKHADSHLGHVFEDGPAPTGLRYCINSAALRFIPKQDLEKQGYGKYRHSFE